MVNVHAIRTGSVRIKHAQRGDEPGGFRSILTSPNWTEWLPIYAWVIEHPEGTILVDTGDTARTMEPGYFPAWHPYYRYAVEMDIRPEEEIGPQLTRRGIDPGSVDRVILTHLHTDHAGGLHHFPNSRILVPAGEYQKAQGFTGKLRGYLPHRWPEWFQPIPMRLTDGPFGPFQESLILTEAADVMVVPTPGHTPDHVSVIVRSDEVTYFIAGDATYTEAQLIERRADGVSPDAGMARATIDRVLAFASRQPTLYLPTHDPGSEERLVARQAVAGLA